MFSQRLPVVFFYVKTKFLREIIVPTQLGSSSNKKMLCDEKKLPSSENLFFFKSGFLKHLKNESPMYTMVICAPCYLMLYGSGGYIYKIHVHFPFVLCLNFTTVLAMVLMLDFLIGGTTDVDLSW